MSQGLSLVASPPSLPAPLLDTLPAQPLMPPPLMETLSHGDRPTRMSVPYWILVEISLILLPLQKSKKEAPLLPFKAYPPLAAPRALPAVLAVTETLPQTLSHLM